MGHFHAEWRRTLRLSPAIKYFKSSEWHSLTGEFRQFTDPIKWPKPTGREAADAKRDSLKCVIANYWIKAISVAVLIPEWDSVRGRHPKAATYFGNDPFRAALQSVIFGDLYR